MAPPKKTTTAPLPADGDADFDRVSNAEELRRGTDPRRKDTDGDGLDDYAEQLMKTNPLDGDSDHDGLDDRTEIGRRLNPNKLDSDGDGFSDGGEVGAGTDPLARTTRRDFDARFDGDGDGLSTAAERRLGTDALYNDTDTDGWTDGDEVTLGSDPTDASDRPQRGKDTDGDGLTDAEERRLGTNPRKRDTDGDVFDDGHEVFHGLDPLKKFSSDEYQRRWDSDSDGYSDATERRLGTNPADAKDRPQSEDPTNDGALRPVSINPSSTLDPFDRPYSARSEFRSDADVAEATIERSDVTTNVPYPEPTVTNFVRFALLQHGDRHQRMAEHETSEIDPNGWDSSELVQWAAGRAGSEIPDGSWRQYQYVHGKGTTLSVEQALQTPGALVFSFPTGDPLASQRPAGAGVAISLGDGRVLEVDQTNGVRMTTDVARFTHAGHLPDFPDSADPGVEVQSAVDQTLYDLGIAQPDPDEIEMPPVDVGDEEQPPDPEAPDPEVPADADPPTGEETPDDDLPVIEMPTMDLRPDSEKLFSDLDGDGLNDYLEGLVGTDILKADSDGDGLSDYLEWMSERSDPMSKDSDADEVDDGQEYIDGTNASDRDSDDDGWGDGTEKGWAADPLDPGSHPLPEIAPPDEAALDPMGEVPAEPDAVVVPDTIVVPDAAPAEVIEDVESFEPIPEPELIPEPEPVVVDEYEPLPEPEPTVDDTGGSDQLIDL